MKYNAYQVNSVYKINRSTVGRWIKAGKLIADLDGYFEESDFLVLFRKSKSWDSWRKRVSEQEAAQTTAKLPLNEPNQLTGEKNINLDSGSTPLQGSAEGQDFNKLNLSNLKLHEEIKEKRRKNAVASGKLISRLLVKRFVGKMGEIDNTEWRSLPMRVIDDVLSICETSDPKISLAITKRLEEEIFNILESVQRSQVEFLNNLPNDDPDADQ